MPVFIEEVVFRAEVVGTEAPEPSRERPPARRREDREALVEAAVAEVLRILRRERER